MKTSEIRGQQDAIAALKTIADQGATIEELRAAAKGDNRASVLKAMKILEEEYAQRAAAQAQNGDDPGGNQDQAGAGADDDTVDCNGVPPKPPQADAQLHQAAQPNLPPPGKDKEPGPEPSKPALPMRFAILSSKGVPRMATLRHSAKRVDPSTGTTYEIGGVQYNARPFRPDPAIRVIDVPELECVRRANFPVPAEEVSQMIMDTPYYQNGLILSWEEYTELKADRESMAKQMEAQRKELEASILAKRGKRGQA